MIPARKPPPLTKKPVKPADTHEDKTKTGKILGSLLQINPFPNIQFLDCPKFKEAADDNWNVAIKGFSDTDYIENIVEKGEIAHFEQFHLFPQCFPKAFFYIVLKWVYME